MISSASGLNKVGLRLFHEGKEYTEYDESSLDELFPNLDLIEFYIQYSYEQIDDIEEIINLKLKQFCDKYNGKGDIANESGFCDFPGNLNVLVFKLRPYLNILEETKGLVPEFVNPKYADETRNKFKSPTRLECLMQDVPKLIKNGEKVGYTYFDRWFCFSACKNNLHDALEKLRKNETGESAFTVERDIFKTNERLMKEICGNLEVINTEPENEIVIGGYKVKFGPKIIIYPSFAPTISELKYKLSQMRKGIKMTNNSILILKNDINIEEGIDLDGYLIVDKDQKDLVVCKNQKRVVYSLLENGKGQIYEKLRGYTILQNDEL